MDKLDIDKIKIKYNNIREIWNKNDSWHYYTYSVISRYLSNKVVEYNIESNGSILNIGSGGNPYCFREEKMLHIDIAEKNIVNKPNFWVGDFLMAPIKNTFSCCVCVGSVINYSNDVLAFIQKIYSCVEEGGFLFLEFENSKSLEFIGTKTYNRNASIIETFYLQEKEKVWVYSEKYITDILKINTFDIIDIKHFHILTPLVYRISKKANQASYFSNWDKYLSHIPVLSKNSSNIILLAQKKQITSP